MPIPTMNPCFGVLSWLDDRWISIMRHCFQPILFRIYARLLPATKSMGHACAADVLHLAHLATCTDNKINETRVQTCIHRSMRVSMRLLCTKFHRAACMHVHSLILRLQFFQNQPMHTYSNSSLGPNHFNHDISTCVFFHFSHTCVFSVPVFFLHGQLLLMQHAHL